MINATFIRKTRIAGLCLLVTGFCLCLSGQAQAQLKSQQDLLIRNVLLVDSTGKSEDRVVNILIRDGKLEVVTEDKISREEADRVVTADRGVITGKLNVGQQSNFIIFREDPRERFEVLLDTKTYASFAIHDGIVVRNRLSEVSPGDADDEPVKAGWLAYTPPPLAVPMSYQDSSRWNRWDGSAVSGIFLSALMLDRINWHSQDGNSRMQVGDLGEFVARRREQAS